MNIYLLRGKSGTVAERYGSNLNKRGSRVKGKERKGKGEGGRGGGGGWISLCTDLEIKLNDHF